MCSSYMCSSYMCSSYMCSSSSAGHTKISDWHRELNIAFVLYHVVFACISCLQHGLMKQTNMEDPYDNTGDDEITGEIEAGHGSDEELPPTPPRPSTPQPAKGLPWTPKVR